jgi:hypothetical protein
MIKAMCTQKCARVCGSLASKVITHSREHKLEADRKAMCLYLLEWTMPDISTPFSVF